MVTVQENTVFLENYHIRELIDSGGFGKVYRARDLQTQKYVAVKIGSPGDRSCIREGLILREIADSKGFPTLYKYGFHKGTPYIIMQLLGPSLHKLLRQTNGSLSVYSSAYIARQILSRIDVLHKVGYIHQDITPAQFLLHGKQNMIYMIDFGLARNYVINGMHQEMAYNCQRVGTITFSSIANHQCRRQGRKDDLESFLYVIVFLLKGKLPWTNTRHLAREERWKQVMNMKINFKQETYDSDLPSELWTIQSYIKSLRFEEEPDYFFIDQVLMKMKKSDKQNFELDWLVIDQSPDQQSLSKKQGSNRRRGSAFSPQIPAQSFSRQRRRSKLDSSSIGKKKIHKGGSTIITDTKEFSTQNWRLSRKQQSQADLQKGIEYSSPIQQHIGDYLSPSIVRQRVIFPNQQDKSIISIDRNLNKSLVQSDSAYYYDAEKGIWDDCKNLTPRSKNLPFISNRQLFNQRLANVKKSLKNTKNDTRTCNIY